MLIFGKVFSYTYDDMSTLDPMLVMYSLVVHKDAYLVKQKRRLMHPKQTLLVKKDIEK